MMGNPNDYENDVKSNRMESPAKESKTQTTAAPSVSQGPKSAGSIFSQGTNVCKVDKPDW